MPKVLQIKKSIKKGNQVPKKKIGKTSRKISTTFKKTCSLKKTPTRQFKKLKLQQLPPLSSWWENAKSIVLFFGTHENNISYIKNNGIDVSLCDDDKKLLKLSFDYKTSLARAALAYDYKQKMQLDERGLPQITPHNHRIIIAVKMSPAKLKEYVAIDEKNEFSYFNRIKFHKHLCEVKKYDSSIYSNLEFTINKSIPKKYIIGYIE